MSLPSLGLQVLYVHFAWSMVLAACGVGLIALRRPFATRWATAWVLLAFAACALPGPASPSYWLGLAFHFPSALLVACCAMSIWTKGRQAEAERVLPVGLALMLLLAGAMLYLDSTGWLSLGLYARGFGPGAALAGLLLGMVTVLFVAQGRHQGVAWAVVLALMVFALCRLPTGNIFDALLDPLLWLWALFSLLTRVARAAAWRWVNARFQTT